MTVLIVKKLAYVACITLINSTFGLGVFVFTRKSVNYGKNRGLSRALSFAHCFSIGLFMAICFLGLYHSSSMKFLAIQQELRPTNQLRLYPLSESFLCVGIFVFWLMDICMVLITSCTESHAAKSSHIRRRHQIGRNISLANVNKANGDVQEDQIDLLPPRDEFVGQHLQDLPTTLPPMEDDSAPRKQSTVHDAKSVLKCSMLTWALGLHSLLESIGFGLMDSTKQVASMGIAMIIHQALCSSMLGLRLASAATASGRDRRCSCALLLLLVAYLLAVPLGASIGLSIHHSMVPPVGAPNGAHNAFIPTSSNCTKDDNNNGSSLWCQPGVHSSAPGHSSFAQQFTMALLQNFAAAAFLYVIFVELLPAEFHPTISACNSSSAAADGGDGEGTSRMADGISATADTSTRHVIYGFMRCFCAICGFAIVAMIRLSSAHG